ncbi:MAG: right-handed parallel beta-helix repeat-containing protein [Candidatus Tectimicrobiota bacterium]
MASPLLESNTIEDDPTRDDVGIHLGVDGLSTVIVRTNSICATAGDNPLRLSLTVFATPAQSTVTGNSFPCGQGAGILLLSGTVSSNSLLKALNGITTLVMQSTVTVANGITLGIETGLTLQGQSRTLQIQGLLNANGVTFASVVLSYQDGSGGTVQNSTFSGVSTPIQLSGNSTLTPAAPTINANTITATSTAIDVRGNTRPTIRNNVMTAPFTGVTVQDTAQPIIRDNTISTNGAGLSYSEFAAGTALGNTIQFQLQGSSGRRGIEVSQAASPTLDNNTITDDPTRDDIGVQLLVDTTSTVVVRTTSICATGGDRPFVLGPGSYGATVTGNLFPCGLGAGVQLASGTASSNVQLRPLNGVSTFNMQSTLTVASGVTLTIASGVTVQGQSRTLVVNGSLQADGVTFMDVFVDYRDGGAGNLRNSTLTGTGPISLSGTSTLTPATPIISNNTITTSGVAIDIRGTARPTVRDNVITTNSRGLRYADASGGTATSNTIRFQLQGSSSRVGIEVNNSASPGVENNTIEDDPTRNDTGIYLGVDALSTAAVRTNNICTTGGDTPLVFGLGVFRVPIQVSVSGNTFPCGLGTGAQIVSGTVNNNAQLQALNGFSTYTIQSTVTVAAGVTLTIPGGLTLQGQSFNRSLVVNGVLNATGATFVDVSLDYRDGSGGTVQNSTFMGSSPIAFSGSSPLTPAAPVITGNTITATSVGIDVSGTARPTLSNNAITTNAVGVRYTSTARGSMTGNSIAFQPEGSSGRRGVEVSQTAAPNIDGNSITDDPTRNDIGIQLLVDTSSTVMVKNNSICATGGDNPLVLGLGVFGSVMNAVVTGNTFPCGQGENIALASGTLTGNTMLRSLDGLSTFTLQSTVTVPSGVTLSIPAGITVQGLNRTLRVNGILNADGATFADVFLDFPSGSRGTIQHSTLSGPTFSAGLSLTSAVMTLRNNLIERFSTALDLAGTATVTAEDNVFRANTTVFRFQAATVRATIANNLFDANTNSLDFSTADILFSAFPAQFQTNAFTGTATQNIISTPGAWNVSGTLRSAPVPYGCASNITISNTATVTLEPGVVIQCPSFRGITVDGELVAIGTPTSPIIFTAANPKAGNRWNGLLIRNKQSALNVTTLQHCIVEFANTGITLDNASIPVRDCLITDNASDGLLLTNSAAPVVEDNAILQNMAHGIHSRTGARPIVHGNSIFGNGQNGIQNDDAVVINAEHNFWGDDTGPRDVPTDTRCNTLSNPVGAGEDVSDCVDFDPWIRVGPSLAGTITLVSGNGQQGQAGQILPQPLVVALRSPLGSPLQGINVIFSIVHGDATIREAMPVATDANGRAMATVQLGATPGEIVIAVTARDVDSPLAMFMGETSGPSLFVMRLAATALDAPDDLFGRAKPGQVTLMWTPTAGADSFEVLRAEHVGGPYTLVGSTASGIYLDRSVVSGRTYFYIVQAIDASSRSGDSNEVAVAVPTPQQRR